jgi:hypothetical protein
MPSDANGNHVGTLESGVSNMLRNTEEHIRINKIEMKVKEQRRTEKNKEESVRLK